MGNPNRSKIDARISTNWYKYCSNIGEYRCYIIQYLCDIKEMIVDIKKDRLINSDKVCMT